MVVTRFYSERRTDIWLPLARRLLATFDIKGATIYPCRGIWRGQTEQTFVIEVISDRAIPWRDIAANLAKIFDQTEVLVITVPAIDAVLVTPRREVRRIS